MRLFSYRDRPVHLGPYPLERLRRSDTAPDLSAVAAMQALSFDDPNPESLNVQRVTLRWGIRCASRSSTNWWSRTARRWN